MSSLAFAPRVAVAAGARRAISLLSPGDVFPRFDHLHDDHHHCVHLHDIVEPIDGHVTPAMRHVEDLVSFLSGWSPSEPLLVHCWAGISRSTATAFIAACLHNPDTDEAAIAAELRKASSTAFPNERIVGFADKLLGRRGRMMSAVRSMGRGEVAVEAS
ncbi:MAG: hypothetical protein K2Q06_06900, partial [Parvularculaceae bacterium]|nr:hypothetical protein [Parvularculaceae bacterium]